MAPPQGYALIWNDEFDGTVLNTNKWFLSGKTCDYANLNPNNVYLDGNSNVVLECSDSSNGGGIASVCDNNGAVHFDFLYGYIEVRAKLGNTNHIKGIFSDIWLNGSATWPPEIDITETGSGPFSDSCSGTQYMDMTLWYGSGNGSQVSNNFAIKDANGNPVDLSANFHIYGMEWTSSMVRFLMDGVETWRITNAGQIPSARMYFNSSIYPDTDNSIWGCGTNFSQIQFPVKMYIDYVRVYQKSTNTGTLDVSSSPEGAEISIDGADQGTVTKSPYQQISNITAGSHTLTLTLVGYNQYTTTFTITAGQTTTLSPTLTPVSSTTGTLDISSLPEGAEISIDGADQGKVTIVPYQPIINIPAGNHTLTLTLAGYQTYTATFTITAGQITTLNPTLTPAVIQKCPCSIWSQSSVPGTITVSTDPNAVELGVKFRSDVNGYITGIRFYKGQSNTGTHIGSLWSVTGTLLGQVTFSGESASGWQQANFGTPIAVTANTTYIVSYHTSVGHYSQDTNYFANKSVDNLPLHALQSGIDGGNGVFEYGSTPAFPINTYLSSNYWVDVVFVTTLPPPTGTLNISSSPEGAEISIDGVDQSKATIVPYQPIINIPAGNHTLTLTLAGYQTYSTTFTITAGQTTTLSPILTPVSLQNCPCSIWSQSSVPGTITVSTDPNAVELGVKFRSDVNGYITGIRFYKGPSNTGTHIGSLWSVTGTLLGQVTFSGESASGWQQANFGTPIAVTANTTYIVSYHTSVGHYSQDTNYFANKSVDNPPLHALQSGIDGGNGVFEYGSTPAFPINTYLSSNYWVDVVFVTTLPPPTGTLNISSSPEGAEIFIDTQNQGKTTPSIISGLPAGSHTLGLSLSGYQQYVTSFTISPGQTTTLSPTLIAEIGTLALSSTPSGANVFIDNTNVGTTPGSWKLLVGTYTLRLSLTGYQDITTSFMIATGVTTTLNLTLIAVPYRGKGLRGIG